MKLLDLQMHSIPSSLHKSVYAFATVNSLRAFTGSLFIITLVLFLLDTLPSAQVGIVWGVYFGVLAVLDYPTGVLGDVIGHRTVLIIAYLLRVSAVVVILSSTQFLSLILFMFLLAAGESQESGALNAWFDNQYNAAEHDFDPSRSVYTKLMGNLSILGSTATIFGLLSGGWITTTINFQVLFWYYLGFLLLTLLAIIALVQSLNVKLTEQSVKTDKGKIGSYFGKVNDSIKEFFSNHALFYYFIGTGILWAANESLWHPLISIRLYEQYSGSIAGASVLRSIMYLSALIWQLLAVQLIDHFKKIHFWVFLSSVVSNSLFFFVVMQYYQTYPPRESVYLPIILGFILVYQAPMLMESVEGILRGRIELDLIPNNIRNSLYSLLPTIARGFGTLFVVVGGLLTVNNSLDNTFIWLILVSSLGSISLGIGLRINSLKTRT